MHNGRVHRSGLRYTPEDQRPHQQHDAVNISQPAPSLSLARSSLPETTHIPTPHIPPPNPFLRPSTPTFNTHRGRQRNPHFDDDDDDEVDSENGMGNNSEFDDEASVSSGSELMMTPLPSRRRAAGSLRRTGSIHTLAARYARRHSHSEPSIEDAMAVDSLKGMQTPRRDSANRRLSLAPKSVLRTCAALQDETNPLEREISHERVLNLNSNALSLFQIDDQIATSPADGTPPPSFGSRQRTMSVSMPEEPGSRPGTPEDTATAIPVRAVAIPNSALKDPATYVSHTSKLNPENSNVFKNHQQQDSMIVSSPMLSPIHPSLMMSPVLDRKNKRKLSGDTDRFDPYKRHHRLPASPTAGNGSGGGGSGNSSTASPKSYFSMPGTTTPTGVMRTGGTPPPLSLPIPSLVFQRQRSPSMSSSSISTGYYANGLGGGGLDRDDLGIVSGASSMMTGIAYGSPQIGAMMMDGVTGPGTPSPRASLGQRLNLGGAQEVFTKMSLGERRT
ncbi:hypothetical protein HDU89_005357 [Geranomyces variabilis]|nr:hypothetical protein HDU89_005357 [Geranomyces variabilis]